MQALTVIKDRFMPSQPAVKAGVDGVRYHEYRPDIRLSHYIFCYWQLSTATPLEEDFLYRVVTDGCMDIFFEAGAPYDNYVMGFSTAFTEFPLGRHFNYIGIRFLPTALPLLFNIDAAELTDKVEALPLLLPQVAQQLGNIASEKHFLQSIKPSLDILLLRLLYRITPRPDNRLYEAIDIILRSQGMLSVQKELQTGVSPRQLRRLFELYIGDTPKMFSKVVRFQQILQARPSRQALRRNKLFFDYGYHDQAHFIREFKHMYGLTPTIALE
jgi:AraC-like DNA-binding protein